MHNPRTLRQAVASGERNGDRTALAARLAPRPPPGGTAQFFPAITLPAAAAPMHHSWHHGGFSISFESHNHRGDGIRLQREYQPTDTDRLGIWYGGETRLDTWGRIWRGQLPDHVIDDFGTLVEVPA